MLSHRSTRKGIRNGKGSSSIQVRRGLLRSLGEGERVKVHTWERNVCEERGRTRKRGREGAFFDHSLQKGEREEERGNGKNAAANLDLEGTVHAHR